MSDEECFVKVWEEPLVIPSYVVGEEDGNPIFPDWTQTSRWMYPYPMDDNLTYVRKEKTYKALYLENKYIKVTILPEVGGRLYAALDKTNGWDFFYRNRVIKPALIGLRGAWTSGGIEYKFPYSGHRATTVAPVDYWFQENPDSSATVVVGEIEPVTRMKWLVRTTLYPDKAYIEQKVILFNRTALFHRFAWWQNSAVHATPEFQTIFPCDFVATHGRTEVYTWPIYKGVDLSRNKNATSPISLFGEGSKDDFFGGYSHDKAAGTVHVAERHLVPGKKMFSWGTAPDGRIWDSILTDEDGPYVELQAGGFVQNQPGFSFLGPQEVKSFKEYWYPVKELGGFKMANKWAALNLEVLSDSSIRIALNTTEALPEARAVLKAGETTIYEQSIHVSPEVAFSRNIPKPRDVSAEELVFSLLSPLGEEIITYSPKRGSLIPLEEPKARKAMEEMSVEERYLRGIEQERINDPLGAERWYAAALKLDPGNCQANCALGILYYRRGLYEKAESKFRRALDRNPGSGQAHYYWGLTLKAQGEVSAAVDEFHAAAHQSAFFSVANYFLGEIALLEEDFSKALLFLDRAISTNTLNTGALTLKAIALRKLGRAQEAERLLKEVLAIDPTDFLARSELVFLRSDTGELAEAEEEKRVLRQVSRGEAQSYLEVAVDYGNAGLLDEAIATLTEVADDKGAEGVNPLIYYYLGYFYERRGEGEKAATHYRLGGMMERDYVFPHRLETIEVLRHALAHNPKDARAHYYLGNLLYSKDRRQEGVREWQESARLEEEFSVVHRNLGQAYWRDEGNVAKGIACAEKAIVYNKKDPRLYLELDQLYEAAGETQKRLELLEKNQEIGLKRSDLVTRQIALYVQLGRFDDAIKLLDSYQFHNWEARYEIHDIYADAHIGRGQVHFKAQEYRKALQDYEAALLYPRNLEVGEPHRKPARARAFHLIGLAHEALGDVGKAEESWEKAVAERYTTWTENSHFQGLALRKLGRIEEADQIFDGLIQFAKECLERAPEDAAMAHYLSSLGCRGKGMEAEAEARFDKALELDKNVVQNARIIARTTVYTLE